LREGAGAAVELVAGGGLPAVELVRPVASPGLGVGADLVDFGDPDELLSRLLLVAEHGDEHPGDEERGDTATMKTSTSSAARPRRGWRREGGALSGDGRVVFIAGLMERMDEMKR
jgi:hypothetical protein